MVVSLSSVEIHQSRQRFQRYQFMILQPDAAALHRLALTQPSIDPSERDGIVAGSGEFCQLMLHMTPPLAGEAEIWVLKITSFLKAMKRI